MARRGQGLCARLTLCLGLCAAAAGAPQRACDAAEAAPASPTPSSAAAGWRRALQPAGARPAGPHIIDVSVALDASTPKFSSADGLGEEFRVLEASHARGDAYTSSLLHLGAHTGAARLWVLDGGEGTSGICMQCTGCSRQQAVVPCQQTQWVQAPMWTAPAISLPRRMPRVRESTIWTSMP